MEITLVEGPITREQIKAAAWPYYEEVVKAVVDVEKKVMAIGGEMHADEEQFLLRSGSRPEHLWGINILTARTGPDMVQFDSIINVKPRSGNRTRGVDNPTTREQIRQLVLSFIQD